MFRHWHFNGFPVRGSEMRKMFDKTALLNWLQEHSPVLFAVGLTLAMAVLRIIHRGGTVSEMLIEGPSCMLVTLSLIPVLEYFELSTNLATAAGIWIGYFGVRKVMRWVEGIANARLSDSGDK